MASIDPDLEGRPAASVAEHRAADGRSVLEQRHADAVRTLTLLWGYPELNQYFDKIVAGTDARLRFDPPALAELMLLAALHKSICPQRPAQSVETLYGTGHRSGPWRPARPRG